MRQWLREVPGFLALNTAIALGVTVLSWIAVGGGPLEFAGRHFPPTWIISNCIGFICATVLPHTAFYWHKPTWLRWPVLVGQLLVLNAAGCIVAITLVSLLLGRRLTFPGLYLSTAVITLAVGIGAALYEASRSRVEAANLELKNRQVEQERALKLASEARLQSIESRVHPHFLFNALNSVSALIREDPGRAEELVGRLSSLLRGSLDTQQESLVPLERELALVRDYLEIQKTRFENRLRYRIESGAGLDAAAALVPPFAIQTLVENSVKYAIAPRPEGGEVVVRATAQPAALAVEVSDDGPGFDAGAMTPGHGLDNLHTRLMALFGAEAALDIRRRAPAGAVVSFRIPQESHARVSG